MNRTLIRKDTGHLAAVRAIDFPMEWKDLSETGTFTGYAAVFGNVDLGGDVVERGAFEEIVKTRDGQVRVLLQHRMDQAIGKANVTQDDKGLKFDGSLVLENANARNAHALMKQGILDGMSIGFDILPDGSKLQESGVRKLTRLKLWEISVVTFGMNPLARVETVKERARNVTNIREYEDLLRDVGGFTNRQAKLLASGGWKALNEARDVSDGAEHAAATQEMLDGLKNLSDNL